MSDFKVVWEKPIPLTAGTDLFYEVELDRIPELPGVYMFFREHGGSKSPMYVGQAKKLKGRIKGQLKSNVKLMKGLENSPNGSRKLTWGVFHPKRGQQLESALDRIERALIRHYIEKYELFNTQGTRVPMETLTSDRHQSLNGLIPRAFTFQKS